ncbi:hypothetical protein K504DRAFT_83890 [Pleomassaria siparia CBS 279.74]|uniref:Secreted protein n=1 Tax=Pleomassaria siparia CBS 279.74 TaxID=1314801 RepID=A0A6G1JZ12_9PLEO|nr:hypothetical protein K504DRAFT_83890 [Pleomassaria siparia CBS 279.74]
MNEVFKCLLLLYSFSSLSVQEKLTMYDDKICNEHGASNCFLFLTQYNILSWSSRLEFGNPTRVLPSHEAPLHTCCGRRWRLVISEH